MDPYDYLLSGVTCRHNDTIKKACAPLFAFLNLNEMWYYKITHGGFKTYLGSNPAWSERYASQKHYLNSPLHCHPKFYSEGVHILRAIPDKGVENVLKDSRDTFSTHPSLLLINRIPDGVEAFGFSSPSDSEEQVHMMLCELQMLKLFTRKFQDENRSLFSVLDDHQINLAEIIGPRFYQNRFSVVPNRHAQRKAFLQKMGIDCNSPLTSREIEVEKLLLLGLSASKVAQEVYLAKRTVEHHIERIKDKLGCGSKTELIQKARELEQFGFLNNLGMN